jgi:hypothetical protein
MAHGVHITKGDNNKRGVERNFTMLSGEQMLERGEEIQITQNSPESTEANIDGYITGMAIGISVVPIYS